MTTGTEGPEPTTRACREGAEEYWNHVMLEVGYLENKVGLTRDQALHCVMMDVIADAVRDLRGPEREREAWEQD